MKYVQNFFICLGIWFTAAIVNAILSTVMIVILEGSQSDPDVFGLSLLFSFLFSAPLACLLWLVALVAQLSGQEGAELFHTMLATAVICALAGAVFFIVSLGTEFKQSKYAVALSVIVAAIAAVMLFRNFIKSGITNPGANHQQQ
ncbi:MAG: hypothetical protein U0V75_11260 [Ferruginibacter sp.]